MRRTILLVVLVATTVPAGCQSLGRKQSSATPAKNGPAPLPSPPSWPAPIAAQPPPPANGILAGQVIDYANRRVPATSIRVVDGSGTSESIQVSTNNEGYFLVQGLQPGKQYRLVAEVNGAGGNTLTGVVTAVAPNPRVLIRVVPGGNPVTDMPSGPDNEASTPSSRPRAAELGRPQISPPQVTPFSPPPPSPPVDKENIADDPLSRGEPPPCEIKSRPAQAPKWSPTRPTPKEPRPLGLRNLDPGPAEIPSCVMVGHRLHNFALRDLQGRPWEFRHHQGQLVLCDFWGSWCPPCLRAIPHLIELQRRYQDHGLEVVGIAYEQGPVYERVKKVARIRDRLGINYRLLLGSERPDCPVKTQFAVRHWPTLVLLDDSGRILWRSEGLDAQRLQALEIIIRQQLGLQ
ncbi:MAG: hypothetical protein KatS3mg105_4220 [Gemmatales bacterium]|nr:MAG: hypothetical protein KatS3mg105_4220 [Gemmatales bacterium]